MNFFDMGIGEILLIIIVALVIWGPGKLPQIARTIGKTMATLRKASQDLTAQITGELEEEEKIQARKKLPDNIDTSKSPANKNDEEAKDANTAAEEKDKAVDD